MFRQLFSTCGKSLAVVRLGLGQIRPNIYLPAYKLSTSLQSELYYHQQLYSILSVNSQQCCQSCRTVGKLVFCRSYANDTRSRHRSSASYITAIFIFMLGAAYAGVPLYRMICQVSIVFDCMHMSHVTVCAVYTHVLNCFNRDFYMFSSVSFLYVLCSKTLCVAITIMNIVYNRYMLVSHTVSVLLKSCLPHQWM